MAHPHLAMVTSVVMSSLAHKNDLADESIGAAIKGRHGLE